MSAYLFDNLHAGLGRVLDLRQAQHGLTASNIANADTPGFKARFMPFDQVLERALDVGEDVVLRRTEEAHFGAPGADPNNPDVEELEAPPWALDGNSVQVEREVVRLTENALLYNSVATGLRKRISLMKFAASDGKSA